MANGNGMAPNGISLFGILFPETRRQLQRIEQDVLRVEEEVLGQPGVVELAPVSPAPAPSGMPSPVISLPLDPEVLSRMIVMARQYGYVQTGIFTITQAVPAGSAPPLGLPVVVAVPPLPGTVTVFLEPMVVTSTYASPLIVVDVNIDGVDVTPPPYEFRFVEPRDTVSLGQFYYIARGVVVTLYNYTDTDITISMKADVAAIDSEFFFRTYMRLISIDVEYMERMARWGGGTTS